MVLITLNFHSIQWNPVSVMVTRLDAHLVSFSVSWQPSGLMPLTCLLVLID